MTLGRTRIRTACPSQRVDVLRLALGVFGTDTDSFELPVVSAVVSYEQLAESLESEPIEALARTVCVVDLSCKSVQSWEVTTDMHPMRPTWLVWRFPEVYWIFLVNGSERLGQWLLTEAASQMHFVDVRDPRPLFDLIVRHAEGFRPWFDPWELRRACIHKRSKEPESNCRSQEHKGFVPLHFGLALDEELAFVAFNGYLLYRQGIPTALVPTRREFHALASNLEIDWRHARQSNNGDAEKARRVTILEDVELNYPDADEQEINDLFIPCRDIAEVSPSSNRSKCLRDTLDKRIEELCLKRSAQEVSQTSQTAPKRIVDQAEIGAIAPRHLTRVFVSSTLVPRNILTRGESSVIKPFAGLYDPEILSNLERSDLQLASATTQRGHSAPGAHQAIAAALLSRVRPLKSQTTDTVSAVHAALLAFEAERLLGHQTYAMALESMTLRHGLEALAECSFAGAADELAVALRVSDLHKHVRRLVFHCATRHEVIGQLWPGAPRWLCDRTRFSISRATYYLATLKAFTERQWQRAPKWVHARARLVRIHILSQGAVCRGFAERLRLAIPNGLRVCVSPFTNRVLSYGTTCRAFIRHVWMGNSHHQDNRGKLNKRQIQFANGMLEALGMLRQIYSQNHKFEEEEHALHKIRRWRVRSFQYKRSVSKLLVSSLPAGIVDQKKRDKILSGLGPIECFVRGLVSIPIHYVISVLNPFVLIVAISSWVVFFAFLYDNLASSGDLIGVNQFTGADWLRHSAATFLAMQQGIFGDPKWASDGVTASGHGFSKFWNITVCEMAVGYLHLAILVAVLIQKITRR